ncbi:MAG: aldehyde dehydrogenase family protein [Anaerolineales bacterium]|nr:aldehyde dehydrogenase family protein [Anaerolineales bacterium]HJO34035.1 aldehyde dehydrogenase family protein [Anaerolineales bacterium]
MRNLLSELKITESNRGACYGVDGWLDDDSGAEVVSVNPTDGQPIASVQAAGTQSYGQVIGQATGAFAAWRERPAPQRGQLVRDLGNALREKAEPLGELIALEMGKIRVEGIGEVQEMIDICDFAVGLSRQLYGLTMQSERLGHRMYEQWHPLGPIGVITAFNFPGAPWAWNAAIAAVCGDTVIWKPSEITPLTAIAVQLITNQVMADHNVSGVFNLLVGDGTGIGKTMVKDTRLPLISFTGSVRTGRQVGQQVAARLGRSILELGGNNGIIVTADANLDLTVRAIVFGAVGTAGQRCTTTRRLIVHRSIVDKLTGRLTKAYAQVPMGDPLQDGILMGPLVHAQAVEAMMAALETARASGGKLVSGGERLPELGPHFVRPAIMRMPQQTALVCEETFAPILYVMEYEELSEAIAMHNAVPQGLSSAIFTGNLRTAERFLSASGSDCGIANVNIGTSGAEIGGAFGGEKDTGGGREAGSDAWKGYMRRQTTTINWSNELPLAQGIQFGD